jgi:2-dehydropantoate 2-reductase
MVALPEIRALQQGVVREVIAVARAEGIVLDFNTSMQAVERIAQTMPAQFSSTAQDMARRKHSEIDHLNGFIARRGRELEIPVPLNQALHALVKLVEVGY